MLEKAALDAVAIVTPTGAHIEQVRLAVAKGLHVFIEKPTGADLNECREIQRLAEQSGRVFAVAFQRRFDISYADAKRRIDAGEIGQPIFYRGYSLDPIWYGRDQAANAGAKTRWFWGMGVHDYDLARWLLGAEPREAYACGGAYIFEEFEKFNDVDNGFALVRFDNNAAAFFYCGRTAPHGAHVESEIVGTKGMLRICDSPRSTRVTQFNSAGEVHACMDSFLSRWEDAYCREMQQFVNEVQAGRQTLSPTAADCTRAVELAELILDSYDKQHNK